MHVLKLSFSLQVFRFSPHSDFGDFLSSANPLRLDKIRKTETYHSIILKGVCNLRLRRYVRLAVWSSASLAVTLFFMGLGLTSVFFFEVYFGDESNLKKSTILAKINEETSIFYLDEETRLGSFFEDYHRRYVPIGEVPQHLIDAVVASEDKYFYDHNGINPVAIFKAFWEGIGVFLAQVTRDFGGIYDYPADG